LFRSALQVRAEEAELAHARDERPRELLLGMTALDHGEHLALHEAPHARPRHALLLAEELVQPVVVDLACGHRDPLAARGVARPRARPYKLLSRSIARCISVHLETLKVFCDVVETRSFSTAASQNFVTQSAVSQQIRTLEDRYGRRLLERTRGNVQLTPAGEILYQVSKEIVQRYQDMEARLQAQAGRRAAGRLRARHPDPAGDRPAAQALWRRGPLRDGARQRGDHQARGRDRHRARHPARARGAARDEVEDARGRALLGRGLRAAARDHPPAGQALLPGGGEVHRVPALGMRAAYAATLVLVAGTLACRGPRPEGGAASCTHVQAERQVYGAALCEDGWAFARPPGGGCAR